MAFKDHFSGHAAAYAQARPTYPRELFQWLADQCLHHDLAWDVGCGNGQASLALAHHFERVHASDPSAEQIAAAPQDPRIHWRVEPAEHCSLHNHTVDLVTVAQAYHWFDVHRFCSEAQRVMRPGAVIAIWSYGLTRVDRAVDAAIHALYEGVLGPYWPPERRHVEDGYRHLHFPFEPISEVPHFGMSQAWDLAALLAYLRTWSAAQRFARDTGRDAVAEATPAITAAWGDPAAVREVYWPLSLRAGRHLGE